MRIKHYHVLCLYFVLVIVSGSLADIIVESRSGGLNNSRYSEVGIKWQPSTSKSTAAGLTSGIGSQFCNLQGDPNARDTAKFTPLINTSGSYQVYVTWNLGNSSTVRYQVFNNTGLQTTVYLLQDGYGQAGPSNANQWISIGTFSFISGTTGRVEVASSDANGVPGPSGNYRVYSDAVKWVYTGVATTPVSIFAATPTFGTSPLPVTFTDNSLNNPTTWNWSFGDGSTSSTQSPSHTYTVTTESYFTVKLIVANTAGVSTSSQSNVIHVAPSPGPFSIAMDSITHSGIIVDDLDSGFTTLGSWTLTTSPFDWFTTYRQAGALNSNLSNATARWRPSLSSTQRYNVYVWYPATTGLVLDANYKINYSGGSQNFYVNETVTYGWYYLGAYSFSSGTTGYVELTNATRTTSGSFNVAADAVLFEPINQLVVDDGLNFGGTFTVQGSWSVSNSPSYFYSTSVRYVSVVTSGVGTATASWVPNLPYASIYQVEVSWPSVAGSFSAASDANFIVTHRNGTESVSVPEYAHGTTFGGHWYTLGTFAFNSGSNGTVKLTNVAPLSNGKVVTADAVRFTTFSPLPALEGGELRGFWAHGLGVPGLRNITEVSALIDTARNYNFNAIFVHGRAAGDAFYDSAYESRSATLGSNTTFDTLSALIMLAHDTSGGKRYIEVHSWLNPYRDYISTIPPTDTTRSVYAMHPEWRDLNTSGVDSIGSIKLTSPLVPDNQEFHIKVWMDVVRNYDVDGVHTDDYFFQGSSWGFNTIATTRFAAEYGHNASSGDSDFSNYRRQEVTNYVKRFYAEALTVKPNLKWSVAPVASSVVDPYYSSSAYSSEFNDWLAWYSKHYFDALVPEVYTQTQSIMSTNLAFTMSTANANNRHFYFGMDNDVHATQTTMYQIRYSQFTAKAHGEVLFVYHTTNNSGDSNTVFYQTLSTQVYSSPTTTAAMPWKSNPPGGIIKGHVYSSSTSPYPYFNGTAVYKSLVIYSGLYGYETTYSDGNGFYMFIDVPYGTYTVSAYTPPGNSGSASVQAINVSVTRGVSTNADLNFNVVVPVEISEFQSLSYLRKSKYKLTY